VSAWRWIDQRTLVLLHDESLAEHGGASGFRNEGLLQSALARAPNLAHYGEPDLAALAACYGVGLAKNHAFMDGNKRSAFLAVGLFLALNGHRLLASQTEATLVMLDVAASAIDEDGFAAWIRDHVTAR